MLKACDGSCLIWKKKAKQTEKPTEIVEDFLFIYCILGVTNTVKQQQLIHCRKLAKPCCGPLLGKQVSQKALLCLLGNLCFAAEFPSVDLSRVSFFCETSASSPCVLVLYGGNGIESRDCEWQIGFLME